MAFVIFGVENRLLLALSLSLPLIPLRSLNNGIKLFLLNKDFEEFFSSAKNTTGFSLERMKIFNGKLTKKGS